MKFQASLKAIVLLKALLLLLSTECMNTVTATWGDPCAYHPDVIATLSNAFKTSLVGQDQAAASLLASLAAHLQRIHQQSQHHTHYTLINTKPLVLSLHGLTGVGKSLTTRLIASSLFFVPHSQHIHYFHGKLLSQSSLTSTSSIQLHDIISRALHKCPLSLFIIEEVHFVKPEIMKELSFLFEHQASPSLTLHQQSIDYSQAIYIFTSNIGGKALQKLAFDSKLAGIARTDIAYSVIQQSLLPSLSKQQSLLPLVAKSNLNQVIPYFPLFKSHVKSCFQLQLTQRRLQYVQHLMIGNLTWTPSVIAHAAEQLTYTGPIADFGCKPVTDIINYELLANLSQSLRQVDDGENVWNRWLGKQVWNLRMKHIHLQLSNNPTQADQVETIITNLPSAALAQSSQSKSKMQQSQDVVAALSSVLHSLTTTIKAGFTALHSKQADQDQVPSSPTLQQQLQDDEL